MTAPPAAEDLLRHGVLCYLTAPTPSGPHCTPVVYTHEGGSIWATTRRGAMKARAWRLRPEAAALIRHGDAAVALQGRVSLHDLLDATTWGSSLAKAATLAKASARFTLKNARFFAGYARDAHRLPLAWTPPARIVVGLHPDRGALLERHSVVRWGDWDPPGAPAASQDRYRGIRRRGLDLPDEAAPAAEGTGVLALEGRAGLVTVPVSYRRRAGVFLCVLPEPHLALAEAQPEARAALVVDRPSSWRASAMVGAMLQGTAESFVPGSLGEGAPELARDARTQPGEAVVRLLPSRGTWWRGWTSGTVGGP